MSRIITTILFIALSLNLSAQTFHQITHTSGSQVVGGKTVTVAPVNSNPPGYTGFCGPFTYRLGNSGPSGYNFVFGSPVYHIRLVFMSIGGATNNPGDTITFWINNAVYSIGISDVSIISNACGLSSYTFIDSPLVTSGRLTGKPNAKLYNGKVQLDIKPGFAINSLRLMDTALTADGAFTNVFFADTGITIQQPYIDTLKCPGDSIYLAYNAYTPFNSGNVFTAQLSNASGSFISPVNIGTLTATGSGTIPCKLPQNITPGNGYRLRIVSSSPVRTSTDNDSNIRIQTGPSSVPIAGSNSSICAGQTLNLTSSNAGTGVSYAWSGPGSYSSNSQNPSIPNATTAHSGDYIVTAGIGSCSRKDTVTVLVKPIPATPTAGNNGPVCSGQDLNLTANSTTSGVSYTWNGPASFSSSSQNPTRTNSTVAMSGTYNVTATLNGCTSPAGTTNAVVNQTPATPTAGSNSPVCAGAAINLTASSATSGVSYTWTGPGGFSDNNQNPAISPATTPNAGVYNVTATLNGCTSLAGTTTVAVNNVSSIGAYPSPNDTICENNKSATLVAVPNNAGSSPQYQWYKNGNAISGASSLSYAATSIADGDTFHCRLIATGICSSPLTLFSNKIGMTVLPNTGAPTVSISASPGLLLSPWQLVTFTATPGGNAGPDPKYQWKRNGQNIAGATSDKWSANNLSDKDTITCVISSSEWCALPGSVESNKLGVNIKLGIDDVDGDNGLVLYPNPNDGRFTIKTNRKGKLAFYNLHGQLFTDFAINSPENHIMLPQHFLAGIYLLHFIDESGYTSIHRMSYIH